MIYRDDLINSYNRIRDHIIKTPLITNEQINNLLNLQIFLKLENRQITNSFKYRGAVNSIFSYKEKFKEFPQKIVIQSSGNHAHAISYIASKYNIELLVYMASNVSNYKINKVKEYGAQVIICDKRSEANFLAHEKQKEGYFFIHPSDNNDVILGQSSCAMEIFREMSDTDYIFTPCGGGGLTSGCYLAAKYISPKCKIIASEPSIANDAYLSVKNNNIYSFNDSPQTIADGARTLAISDRCFNYLKKISEIIEVSEDRIIYWQEKLETILKLKIEPTSALPLAAIESYTKKSKFKGSKKICAIITGGNVI